MSDKKTNPLNFKLDLSDFKKYKTGKWEDYQISVPGKEITELLNTVQNDPEQVVNVIRGVYKQSIEEQLASQSSLLESLRQAQLALQFNLSQFSDHGGGAKDDIGGSVTAIQHALNQVNSAITHFENNHNFNAFQKKMNSTSAAPNTKLKTTPTTSAHRPTSSSQLQPPINTTTSSQVMQQHKKELRQLNLDGDSDFSGDEEKEQQHQSPTPFSTKPKPKPPTS